MFTACELLVKLTHLQTKSTKVLKGVFAAKIFVLIQEKTGHLFEIFSSGSCFIFF